MFKDLRKNLTKNLKFKRPELNLFKFDLALIFGFLIIHAVLVGLITYNGIYHFDTAFLRSNYVGIAAMIILNIGILYITFREYVKKYPTFGFLGIYLFVLLLFIFNIIGIVTILENLTNRSRFGQTNFMFIFLFIILIGLFISKYDYPLTTNARELYRATVDHFYRNFGLFIALALSVCVMGFVNATFIYAPAFIILAITLYLAKAILANVRK